jgi:RHS repeat-associated protein
VYQVIRCLDGTGQPTKEEYHYLYDGVDNPNLPLTISGQLATSDILGNRLTLGTQTYTWDALNRLVSFSGGSSSNGTSVLGYSYRADGMRVRKSNANGSTLYRYDGQMGFEDVTLNGAGSVTQVVACAIGARGVDSQAVTANGTTAVYYPLYDAHGKTMANLTPSSESYSLSNQRSYDAWGAVRLGASTGDPTGRYCANLGHKQDDESGLVYMRARYYEPGSGRYISQDPDRQGLNWSVYCSSDPVNKFDSSGKSEKPLGCELYLLAGLHLYAFAVLAVETGFLAEAVQLAMAACFCFMMELSGGVASEMWPNVDGGLLNTYEYVFTTAVTLALTTVLKGIQAGQDSLARPAVYAVGLYALESDGALLAIDSPTEM